MERKKENLFINAILLTATMMIMRSIGVIFNVYISNEIGTEGMGLYKLIGTVSMIAITFATSGVSSAVTRIVAEEVSKKEYNNVKYVMLKACTICGVLGITACIILSVFSKDIASLFLKDTRVILSLKIFAVSIPFISISACLKGYFYAVRDIFIPITNQLAEEFIKISVIILLLDLAVSVKLEYGCAVLVLGAALSDILSCFYVFIAYKLDNKESGYLINIKENTKGLTKRLFKISVPIAANSYLMSIFSTVQMILIPLSLIKFGMSESEAISVLGGVMGMVFPIIMFPATLLMSLAMVLMPEISRARAINNKERLNSIINRSIGFTSIIGIISFFIFFTFYNELSMAIYNRQDIGMIFKVISFIIPFMYLDMIMGGILNGLNEQVKSLEYQIMESILKILGIYFLVPIKGIEGLIIVIFISTIFSFTLNFVTVVKVTNIKINLLNWVVMPMIFGIISTIFGRLIWGVLTHNTLVIEVNTIIAVSCAGIVYLILLKTFNCIKIRD
ncbi:MAG: oligosaccharide flippase family protein [Clostridium celatum]|nr:oligosaccharide flippase family protein [Clostridium celatum]MDU4980406.1 oligosaccharide flippase family protein [Clostridium celatum]